MPRKATGLERPLIVPVNLDQDEDELLAREVEEGTGRSKTALLREGFFKGPWRNRLVVLREKQKHLPGPFRREVK